MEKTSDKGLIFITYKEFLQLNKIKKDTNKKRTWQMTGIGTSEELISK